MTLAHSIKRFGILNQQDMLTQLRLWKSQGVTSLAKNVRERDINGEKVYFFVVQPVNLDDCGYAACPLSLAFGFMVRGYTYVAKEKSVCDLVLRYLA